MTPWASVCTSLSLARSNSNPTAFDFVCVHTERQRFLRVSVWSNSLTESLYLPAYQFFWELFMAVFDAQSNFV